MTLAGPLLVFVGGTVGTASRYVLTTVTPQWFGMPFATLGINVVGALLLGLLLELLALRGPDRGRLRAVRLLLGTGFLGGFTTYSALAVDTDDLLRSGQILAAAAYAVITVVLGVVGAIAGMALAHRLAGEPGPGDEPRDAATA